jgi:hypothetical protein
MRIEQPRWSKSRWETHVVTLRPGRAATGGPEPSSLCRGHRRLGRVAPGKAGYGTTNASAMLARPAGSSQPRPDAVITPPACSAASTKNTRARIISSRDRGTVVMRPGYPGRRTLTGRLKVEPVAHTIGFRP